MDLVGALVNSLVEGTRRPDEIVVVDNTLTADSPPPTRDHPGVTRFLQPALGLNVAGARNAGWRTVSADLVVFIDDDNTVAPAMLEHLEAFAALPGVGLLAPVSYSALHPEMVWCGGIARSMWTTRTRFLHNGANQLPSVGSWETLDMPNCFALPRAVLEAVGGFDAEVFPFHYEEADLGERVRRRGLRAIVVRDAGVFHQVDVNTSAGGLPGREMARAFGRDGGRRVRALSRSRVRFHRRHGSAPQRVASLGLFIPAWLLIASLDVLVTAGPLGRHLRVVAELWRGAVEGMAARVG